MSIDVIESCPECGANVVDPVCDNPLCTWRAEPETGDAS